MDDEVLLRWKIAEGNELVIAAVRNAFDVRFVSGGHIVRARRFKLPRAAFDAAHSWRRELLKTPNIKIYG